MGLTLASSCACVRFSGPSSRLPCGWIKNVMEMERGHLLGEPQVRECHTEPSSPAQPGSDALQPLSFQTPSTVCGRERKRPSESCPYQSQGDENPLEMSRCVRAQVIFQALVVGCGEGMAELYSSASHPPVPVVPVVTMGSVAEADASIC